jgi:hypothetical protein
MKSTDILVTLQEYRRKHPTKSISFETEGELVAEVEHLRATVAALRASVPPTHPSDYGHEVWSAALVDAKKEGARSAVEERAAERAAVVAWLRENAEDYSRDADGYHPATALWEAALRIESGWHRREETK